MVVKLYPPYRNFSLPRPWILALSFESLIIQPKTEPNCIVYCTSYLSTPNNVPKDFLNMWCVNIKLIKENERLSIELFMDHHTKDTHLCGTAIVKLSCP